MEVTVLSAPPPCHRSTDVRLQKLISDKTTYLVSGRSDVIAAGAFLLAAGLTATTSLRHSVTQYIQWRSLKM